MRPTKGGRKLVLLAGAAFCGATAAPTLAQEAEVSPSEAESSQETSIFDDSAIVVTATRREESLNSIPVSVSAVSSQQLEALGVEDVADVQVTVPNFNVSAVVTRPNDPILVIRGLLKRDGDATLDTAVGVYVDDVFLARGYSVMGQLLDAERVEVLRGPQGTLFGRNTIGGAVQVISKKPKLNGDNDGYIKASLGTYDLLQLEGASSFSLGSTVAFRVAGKYLRHSGYTKSLLVDDSGPNGYRNGDPILETVDTNDADNLSFRASFAWEPSPDTRLDLSYYRAESDTNGVLSKGINGDLGGSVAQLPGGFACAPGGCVTSIGQAPATGGDFYRGLTDVRPNGDSNVDIYIANIRHDFGGVTAKVIASHARADSQSAFNTDGIVGFGQNNVFGPAGRESASFANSAVKQTTLEFQLSGSIGNSIDWLGGLYYFEERASDFLINSRSNIVATGPSLSLVDVRADNDSKSIYGSVNWSIADPLTLRVGGRYTRDKKAFTGYSRELSQMTNTAVCAFNPALSGPSGTSPSDPRIPGCVLKNSQDFDNFTWDISLDYKIAPDTLVYGKVGTGYRTGGISLNANSTASVAPFKEDRITSYELGLKTDVGRSAHFNLSTFYSDYRDVQQNVISTSVPFFGISCAPGYVGAPVILTCNIGDAKVYGLELDGVIEPVKGLSLLGTYGWTHIDFDIPVIESVFLPEHTFSLTGAYQGTASGMPYVATVSYQWSGPWYSGQPTLPIPRDYAKVEGYKLLNFRFSLDVSDHVQASIWGRNLTKQEYYGAAVTVTNPIFGINAGTPGAPRTFGADVKITF